MDAMQSLFAHLQDISPISVGSITFESARSPRFVKMRAVWLMARGFLLQELKRLEKFGSALL